MREILPKGFLFFLLISTHSHHSFSGSSSFGEAARQSWPPQIRVFQPRQPNQNPPEPLGSTSERHGLSKIDAEHVL
jgi:hypothetical protein